MSTASANTEAETHSRYIDMDSLKEDTFYVLDFDLPEARGGHGRTVGLYKFGLLLGRRERDGPPARRRGFDLSRRPQSRSLGLRPRRGARRCADVRSAGLSGKVASGRGFGGPDIPPGTERRPVERRRFPRRSSVRGRPSLWFAAAIGRED